MKKQVFFILKLLFSVFLLILIIKNVDISKITGIIKNVNWILFFIALIVYCINFIIGAFNIKLLIKPLKKNIKFLEILKYYMLSWSIGLCIPGKIGEFSIIYLLKKHKISIGQGLVVSIIDKFFSLVVFIIVASLGFFIFFDYGIAIKLTIISIVIFVILLYLIMSNLSRNLIKRIILRGYSKLFRGFSKEMFKYFREEKIILLINFILTFIKLVISSIAVGLVFLALGSYVGAYYIILISAIITILSLIPISVGGLGVREISAVYLYSLLGINTAITIAVYFIFLLINYITAFAFVITSKKHTIV